MREGEGCHFFDVSASGESALGAREDNSTDFGMIFKFKKGAIEFVNERNAEGVKGFEPVKGHWL